MGAIPNLQLIGRECRKLDPQAWRDPTDDPVPPVAAQLSLEVRRRWEGEILWLRQRADDLEQMLKAAPR